MEIVEGAVMLSKVIAIIQARVGSTRLPGKVLLPLGDKSVLEHVIARVKKARNVLETLVATSINKEDEKIAELCRNLGVRVFRGSEKDVLDRFYHASLPLRPGHIVRITADCPVIDPKVIDETIEAYLSRRIDYIGNRPEKMGFPDGQDVEVFKFSVLEKSWKEARLYSEREHVTAYIKNHPELFKLGVHNCFADLFNKRWTLDREDDYTFVNLLYENLYKKNKFFGVKEILILLKQHPEYEKVNAWIPSNEGYLKSLREDKILNEG